MATTPLLRPLAVATTAAALLGGCAAEPPARDPAATDSGSPPQDAPSSASGSPPLPEAADGTDLDACADADCEVLVEEGDEFTMDGSYGVDRFAVDAVGDDGLSVSGYGPGTTLTGHLPPPAGEDPPLTFVMNGITVTLLALEGSSAVMSLSG